MPRPRYMLAWPAAQTALRLSGLHAAPRVTGGVALKWLLLPARSSPLLPRPGTVHAGPRAVRLMPRRAVPDSATGERDSTAPVRSLAIPRRGLLRRYLDRAPSLP